MIAASNVCHSFNLSKLSGPHRPNHVTKIAMSASAAMVGRPGRRGGFMDQLWRVNPTMSSREGMPPFRVLGLQGDELVDREATVSSRGQPPASIGSRSP